MPVQTTSNTFPIAFSLPLQRLRRTFVSRADVAAFLQAENDAWSELLPNIPNRQIAQVDIIDLAGANILRTVFQNCANSDDDDVSTLVEALSTLEQHPVLILQSPMMSGVLPLASNLDKRETVGILFVALSRIGSPRVLSMQNRLSPGEMAAISFAMNRFAASDAKLNPSKASFEKLVAEVDTQVNELNNIRNGVEEWRAKSEDIASTQLKSWREFDTQAQAATSAAFERMTHTCQAELQKFVGDVTSELEEFKKKVRIDVALKGPATFWEDKADAHGWTAGIAMAVFLSVVGGSIWWIEANAVNLLQDAITRIIGNRENIALGLVPLTILTIPALGVAWILRHVSRVIVQNLSLQADARLRGTITKTFRALAEDRAMSETELAIALNALFRPLESKDHSDISPPNLADIMKLEK